MSQSNTRAREPWIAVILSMLCTGLGHVYVGRMSRGLVLFFVALLLVPCVVGLALVEPSRAALLALMSVCLVVFGIYVFAIIDASRIAKRTASYELEEYNRPLVYILFVLVSLVLPLGATLFVRSQYLEAFKIPTGSMVPTLLPGDRVLVDKHARYSRLPRRGDVIVVRVPQEGGRAYVKRIIGLPGDRVQVEAHDVLLNGVRLEQVESETDGARAPGLPSEARVYEERLGDRRYHVTRNPDLPPGIDCPEQEVPEGGLFVMGDHRQDSRDSRHFGFVRLEDVVGPVHYVYWPAGSWSRFGPLGN